MKIAFAALYDLKDINRGSGTYYHIYKELLSQNHIVYPIGPLKLYFPFLTKFFRFISKRILKKKYRSYQDSFIGKEIGRRVLKELEKFDYDILLTNDYAIAGYTKINKPIVLWTDEIFPSDYKTNAHPWLMNLSWISVYFCKKVVRHALKNISFCLVPGSWNQIKIQEYGIIYSDSIRVIPFGSNMDDPGNECAKERNFNKIIKQGKIRLLFIGKDWELKGGETALKVVKELNFNGRNASLHIVGCPNYPNEDYDFIHNYGFLDKNDVKDLKTINQLYCESDVLILPSVAEGFGISYVEAASFGLPSLGYNTQAVTTSVKDKISGRLISLGSDSIEFYKIINSWYDNPNSYNELVKGARLHYSSKCNWTLAVNSLTDYLKTII